MMFRKQGRIVPSCQSNPIEVFLFFVAWIHTRQVDQEFGTQNFEQPLVVLPIFWVKYNKPSVGLLCSGAV